MLYIDLDGYWGDTEDLVVIDDSEWTDEDNEAFTQAHNDGQNRIQLINLAKTINYKNEVKNNG